MTWRVWAPAVLGSFLLASSAPRAQSAAADKLASAKAVECAFSVYATVVWKSGAADATLKPSKLSFGFDSINTDEGTARVVGKFGPSDIIVRFSSGVLHFIQSFREGPLYATTIFPMEMPGGRLQAVHTRHENTLIALPGFTSKPEQYYGDCGIVP